MLAPIPYNEAERLAILRELQLLDTDAEPAFDALTRVAATLLDVPIALVSLVDASRQWFKSRQGLAAAETPRELAFCAHTIVQQDPLVVPDATQDRRFQDNPLVTGEPAIRAYAGIPLRTSEGHAIGTLCVIDQKPRAFNAQQLALLQDLATAVNQELLHRERALRASQLAARSVQAVEASEQLYHATFDCAGIGIGLVGLDGRWMRVNPKMAKVLGREVAEIHRLTFQDITHPDDLDTDLGLVKQLLDGQADSYTLEKRYLRPDGSVVWGHLTVTLVRDGQGKPLHFVSLVEDITQRRATEEALARLRHDLEDRVTERTAALQRANAVLADSVAQLRESEKALHDSRADLHAVLTHAHDAYVCMDTHGRVVEWNRQAHATFGWSREEALGRRLEELIIPLSHRRQHGEGLARLNRTGQARVLNQRLELPVFCRDGRVIPCEVTITELHSQVHGRVYAAFLQDISLRKQAERELAETHEALRRMNHQQHLMLDNEMIGIVRIRDRRVVWANRAFEQLFGYDAGELTDGPIRVIYRDEASYERVGSAGYEAIRQGRPFRIQMELAHRSGDSLWVDMSGAQLSEQTGETLWLMQDITAMKRYQQKVEEMAFHDGLTGLPNRSLLHDRLHQALATAQRAGHHVAVCFADLNGFKAVNDVHGHEAGDELLREIARRLRAVVRSHDTVARLGGDEFVLVLTTLDDPADAHAVVQRAQVAVRQPVTLPNGVSVQVSSSFGLAWAQGTAVDLQALLAEADAAMYLDKRGPRPPQDRAA